MLEMMMDQTGIWTCLPLNIWSGAQPIELSVASDQFNQPDHHKYINEIP